MSVSEGFGKDRRALQKVSSGSEISASNTLNHPYSLDGNQITKKSNRLRGIDRIKPSNSRCEASNENGDEFIDALDAEEFRA